MEIEGGRVTWQQVLVGSGGTVEASDLHVLRGLEIINCYETDFGDTEVTLTLSKSCDLRWSVEMGAPSSFLDLPVVDVARASKLQLMAHLLRNGWRERAVVREPFRRGSEQHFVGSFRAATAYFRCLAEADRLFARGVGEIHHMMRDAYYACLDVMSADALAAMHARPDLRRLKRFHFLSLREGLHVDEVLGRRPLAANGPQLAEDPSDSDAEAEVLREPAMAPVPVDRVPDPFQPLFVRGVVIKFDRCSHVSGVQRGYIRCDEHPSCWRYAQVTGHPSKRHLAAYLFAWREMGHDVGRIVHVSPACQPHAGAVSELLDEVEM